MSECQYDGNISCKRTTAAESNIMGYSVCSYFWSGSETLSSIDLTSALSDMGDAEATATQITSHLRTAHAASVASIIRSTVSRMGMAEETAMNQVPLN
jgi:proline dehydrogenase